MKLRERTVTTSACIITVGSNTSEQKYERLIAGNLTVLILQGRIEPRYKVPNGGRSIQGITFLNGF